MKKKTHFGDKFVALFSPPTMIYTKYRHTKHWASISNMGMGAGLHHGTRGDPHIEVRLVLDNNCMQNKQQHHCIAVHLV